MRMRVLWLVMLLVPVTAGAQETTAGPAREGIIVTPPAPGSGVLRLAERSAQSQTPARPDPARRRPSMVGYINDGTIESRVRVRFDAGYGIDSPDRAEFFYAKCGCYRELPTNLDIYDPDAAGPGGGILTDTNVGQFFILGEYAVVQNRASLFVEVPFRWLRPQEFAAGGFDNQTGISDVRFGAKFGLMASDSGHATVMFQVTAPSGDSRKGLGTNYVSLEPSLLVGQRVGDRVGIEAQFGAIFPTDGSPGLPTSSADKFSGDVLYYGIGPSFDVFSSDAARFSPVVELVGWRVLSGFRTVCDGAPCFLKADEPSGNIVNIKIGGRLVLRDRSSIYVGFGKALTDQHWYDKILRVEFRQSF